MFDENDDYNFEELPPEINVQDIAPKLPQYSMTKLCDIVICDRYLGFNHDLAVLCMEELGKRRVAGDTFEFEDYIDREYKALPKIDSSMIDLRSALGQMIDGFKK